MLTLSVKPIWAHAIFFCGKDIENRNWFTDFRGTLLIHSSRKNSLRDLNKFNKFVNFDISNLISGAIIGSVDIVDCVNNSGSKWFTGQYGFVLKNPRLFTDPIFTTGHHGLWFFNG